ncbi:MAG: hypothetical protein HYZ13_10190 [Acidobacteria bacterium]|nr:hypothetical protein [Acidobacteriota bacterium]
MNPDPLLIRGALVPLLRELSRAQVDAGRWETFLATLPPDNPWRQVPAPGEWVPVAALVACDEAFIAWSGIESRRVRGEVLAELMFGAKVDEGARNPGDFLRGIHDFWEANAQGLHVTLESLLPGEALVRIEANPPDPEWFPTTAGSWFRRSLELHGGKDVTLQSMEATGGIRYRLRWR